MRSDYFRQQAQEAIAQGIKKAGEYVMKAGDYAAGHFGTSGQEIYGNPQEKLNPDTGKNITRENPRYKWLELKANVKSAIDSAKEAVIPHIYDAAEDLYVYGTGRTEANRGKKQALREQIPLTPKGKEAYDKANFVFIPTAQEFSTMTGEDPEAILGLARKYKTVANLPFLSDETKEALPTQILINEEAQKKNDEDPNIPRYDMPIHELAHYERYRMPKEEEGAFDMELWNLYKTNPDFRNFLNWRASHYRYTQGDEPALSLDDQELYAVAGEYINYALQGKLNGPRAVPRGLASYFPQMAIPENMLSSY